MGGGGDSFWWQKVCDGFDRGVVGTFGTHRARHGTGSKGVIQLGTGNLPDVYFLEDPSWFPGKSKAAWQPVTSAGVGKPEPLRDRGLALGKEWIARDLIQAIEEDCQP